MDRSEFIKTVSGQEQEHFRRRLKVVYLRVSQEPKTKKISNGEALQFRKAVHEQLRLAGRRRFRGDIVFEISFSSTAAKPQPVQTLVKNYLDLLHKPMPHIDKLEKLLFDDDRQIKLLIANHYTGIDDPSVYIKVYRFSYFIKDAEYAQNILRNNFTDEKYYLRRNFEFEERPEYSLNPSLIELIRDFQQLKKKQSALPAELLLFQEDNLRRQILEEYLRHHELRLGSLLEYLQNLFVKNRRYQSDESFEQLFKISRDYMFIGLDFIPMGGVPLKEGETGPFRIHLQNQLRAFVKSHPFLFPLLQPAGLTIICIPPAYNAPDADNLARQIVSFFDEICRPPLSHTSLPGMPTIRTGKPRIATSSYQILYLPRNPADPTNGKIMVLLDKYFMSLTGLWAKLENLIEKWEHHTRNAAY